MNTNNENFTTIGSGLSVQRNKDGVKFSVNTTGRKPNEHGNISFDISEGQKNLLIKSLTMVDRVDSCLCDYHTNRHGVLLASLSYLHIFGGTNEPDNFKKGLGFTFHFCACYLTPQQDENRDRIDPVYFCKKHKISYGLGDTPQEAVIALMDAMKSKLNECAESE